MGAREYVRLLFLFEGWAMLATAPILIFMPGTVLSLYA